jgi:hypothetical protein
MTLEEQEMVTFLKRHLCKCGGTFVLTGVALYSSPLRWVFRCECKTEGHVGYTTLAQTAISLKITNEMQ